MLFLLYKQHTYGWHLYDSYEYVKSTSRISKKSKNRPIGSIYITTHGTSIKRRNMGEKKQQNQQQKKTKKLCQ